MSDAKKPEMVDFTFKRPWTYAGKQVCKDGEPETIHVHKHKVESLKARKADQPLPVDK